MVVVKRVGTSSFFLDPISRWIWCEILKYFIWRWMLWMLSCKILKYSHVKLFHSSRESGQEFWLYSDNHIHGHLKGFPCWLLGPGERWNNFQCWIINPLHHSDDDGGGVVHTGPPFRLPYLISLKILISQAAAESRAELCNDHQPIQLFLYTRHT